VGDLVWVVRRTPPLPDIKLVGEYQGAAFHSSPEQRAKGELRKRAFINDGWRYEEIWNADRSTPEARRLTVVRFAKALELPNDALDLSACEPRFFSRFAMERAELRDTLWRMRYA
jgi:hypothetical protein